jgi:DNA-binding MarR family transcriptional regulator
MAHRAAGAGQDESEHRSEVAARLALAVGRIGRRSRPAAGDLSQGLVSALSTIVRKGPMRIGDLARIEVIAAPTVTRLVADLEGRGLVARTADPADGRAFVIESTPAGVEAVEAARRSRAELVGRLLEGCTDEEFAAIAAALPALESAAGIEQPELTRAS